MEFLGFGAACSAPFAGGAIRGQGMKIQRVELDEVMVPARPDSINSPEVDYALHKLALGGKAAWTQQFDRVSKTIVQIHLGNGVVGLGETYRGMSQEQLRAIAQELLGLNTGSLNLQELPIPPGRVYDGFECALIDAVARSYEIPLYQLLGGRHRDRVRCGFWSGHRTTADAVRKAREARSQGYDCIKFKCTLADPVVEWCEAIASACPEDLQVILDPNERFENVAEAERIAHKLEPVGNVLCLEDPLPRWNLNASSYLRRKIRIPLALHVSLPYAELGQMIQDVLRALQVEASDYFNFNAGIYNFKRMATLADLGGLPYWHGSEIDLGVLEASYVHKSAASALAVLPADIFGRLIREHDLLREPLRFENGRVAVPEGCGLGVDLDPAALEHYRLQHWECAL